MGLIKKLYLGSKSYDSEQILLLDEKGITIALDLPSKEVAEEIITKFNEYDQLKQQNEQLKVMLQALIDNSDCNCEYEIDMISDEGYEWCPKCQAEELLKELEG